jgi:SAM-dependent methyltransferase
MTEPEPMHGSQAGGEPTLADASPAKRASLGERPGRDDWMRKPEYAASRTRRLGFDPNIPNVARIYDALLGGKDNFAADRQAAERLLSAVPGAVLAARENRAFLGRAVRFLAGEAGIRQFLDIGTGLPTNGNVHEIAQAANTDARVVYADHDPMVVLHANALLVKTANVSVVNADLRYPRNLLTSVQGLIHFDEPVAVLLVAVLHFLEDRDDPQGIVECIVDHLAPGSHLVISHVTGDDLTVDAVRDSHAVYDNASGPCIARARGDIEAFFDQMMLLAPGLVNACEWRPDRIVRTSRETLFYAGVGRKTASPAGMLP